MPRPVRFTKEEAEKNKIPFFRFTRRDRFTDMRLKSFGSLSVVWFAGKQKDHFYWYCECVCGSYIRVSTNNLRSGATKSCGCAPRKKYEKILSPTRRGYKKEIAPPFQDLNQYYQSTTGFKKNISGFVYIQKVSGAGQKFLKYGITNDWPDVRAKLMSLASPHKHEVVDWWCFEDGRVAWDIELQLKRVITPYKVIEKFAGHTETAKISLLELIRELIQEYSLRASCQVIRCENMQNNLMDRPLARLLD